MSRLERGEDGVGDVAEAHCEHVVRPDAEAQDRDGDRRSRHERVSEDGLAREDWHHLRDHAEGREGHDVDLRVTEAPEKMLPHERRTALRGQEQMRAEEPVDQKHHT